MSVENIDIGIITQEKDIKTYIILEKKHIN